MTLDIAYVNKWGHGGGIVWTVNLTNRLSDLGAEITFYTLPFRGEQAHSIEQHGHVEVESVDTDALVKRAPPGVGGLIRDIDNRMFARRATRRIAEGNHDLLIVSSNVHFGRLLSKLSVPSVLVLHGTPHSLWYDFLHPWSSSYDLVDQFDVAISTGTTAAKISDQVTIPVATINPGVDTDRFFPDQSPSSGGKSILYVGRFSPEKNVSLLLEAFADLHSLHPEATLTLVGNGPLRSSLEQSVVGLEIDEAVKFAGYVDRSNLPSYYQSADLVAVVSKHESFGMVILEAMSCETPVVSARVGWAPNLITEGENGFLFDVGSKQQLVDALDEALSPRTDLGALGRAARMRVQSGYRWQDSAETMFQLCRGLVEEDVDAVSTVDGLSEQN